MRSADGIIEGCDGSGVQVQCTQALASGKDWKRQRRLNTVRRSLTREFRPAVLISHRINSVDLSISECVQTGSLPSRVLRHVNFWGFGIGEHSCVRCAVDEHGNSCHVRRTVFTRELSDLQKSVPKCAFVDKKLRERAEGFAYPLWRVSHGGS